jgi:molybdopterin molybdotransferase
MELFQVKSIEEAYRIIREAFTAYDIETETINEDQLLGRVSSLEMFSAIEVPHFNRSTVDGYAVKSEDVSGSSESMPMLLELIGEVEMGRDTQLSLSSGQCVYVPTGGMLPAGADSVVMIEYTEPFSETSIAVYSPTVKKENVLAKGDDLQIGQSIMEKGQIILSKDLGVLASTGHRSAVVYKKPKVALISTGDEIVTRPEDLSPGRILDINTFALKGLIKASGAIPVGIKHYPDDYDILRDGILKAMEIADMVIVSGGSSMGEKDNTAKIFNEIGDPGVLFHGLSIKPGKPTIVAKAGKMPLIGLPGQPVSAMIVYRVIVDYLLKEIFHVSGLKESVHRKRLTRNIMGAPGKTTFQMVSEDDDNGITPIYGKSGMIRLIASANGYVIIPSDIEGYEAEEEIDYYRFI